MVRKLAFVLAAFSGCSVDVGFGGIYFKSGDALFTSKPKMVFDSSGGVAPGLPEAKKNENPDTNSLFAPGRSPL